jgi:lysophospholipase L1-like esterase
LENDQVLYQPEADFAGTSTFQYTLIDAAGATSTTNVEITVTPVNDAPVAANDSISTDLNGTTTFDPAENDNDIDSSVLTASLVDASSEPASSISTNQGGSVVDNGDGTFTYSAPAAYSGQDSFTYLISDGSRSSQGTVNVHIIPVNRVISHATWSLMYVDSEETEVIYPTGADGAGEHAFDDNPATIWQTDESNPKDAQPRSPHELQIDMGVIYELDGLRYLARQDDIAQNGRVREYAFYTSLDGVNWGNPVAAGLFDNTSDEQEIGFSAISARYIRFVSLSEVNRQPWASIAELNVLGNAFQGNHAPLVSIVEPPQDMAITVNDSIRFAGTASDVENATLSYKWHFDGAGIADINLLDAGEVQFTKPGTYEVTFNANDGLRDAQRAATRIIKVIDPAGSNPIIPHDNWSVSFVSSEQHALNPSDPNAEDWLAHNAFDGNSSTVWATQFGQYRAHMTHSLEVNLGGMYMLDAVRYLPFAATDRAEVEGYMLFISEDGVNWGMPVAVGNFPDPTTTAYAQERIFFKPTRGQFFRFVILSSYVSDTSTLVAELNMEGKRAQCEIPHVKLINPKTNDVRSNNLTLEMAACFSDTAHAGWSVAVDVDGARKTEIPVHNVETDGPYKVTFSDISIGDHDIDVYAIDELGNAAPNLEASDWALNVGVGGQYLVAIGDSITNGYGDNDLVPDDNTSADGRNGGGGFTPILNDSLTTALGTPHTVIDEGINGFSVIHAIDLLSELLGRHKNAQTVLLMLGTNDAGYRIPTGLGKNPGESGYTNSYKDYMQRMITMVQQAGKDIVIAKPPHPNWGIVNPDITERVELYGQVVDELVAANNLAITGPDFYSYFSGKTELYNDKLHPNSMGYSAMGQLWSDALTQ